MNTQAEEPRMKEYIALDSHRRYSLLEREEARTGRTMQLRIERVRGAVWARLRRCQPGSAVALEATGHWYWSVGEIEAAGLRPLLVHPRKAKLMMGLINKTDKLDVHGLNRLQRNGTLPTVWIPAKSVARSARVDTHATGVSAQRHTAQEPALIFLRKRGQGFFSFV
jgi:hypothetical protein